MRIQPKPKQPDEGYRVRLSRSVWGPPKNGADWNGRELVWLASFAKEIRLPFPPYPSLNLAGYGKISAVSWFDDDPRFVVTLERDECDVGIDRVPSFKETKAGYLESGWTLTDCES